MRYIQYILILFVFLDSGCSFLVNTRRPTNAKRLNVNNKHPCTLPNRGHNPVTLPEKQTIEKQITELSPKIETSLKTDKIELSPKEVEEKVYQRLGIKIGHRSLSGNTPLIVAAQINDLVSIRILLKLPDNLINVIGEKERNALMWALAKENITCARLLLQQPNIDVDKQDYKGNTSHIYAVMHGHVDIMQDLLERVKDINIANKNGDTALIIAARQGNFKMVDLLLNRVDIQVNRINEVDESPLIVAAMEGHVDVVQRLLKRSDIKVNRQDQFNDTALIHAARAGYSRTVQALLSHPGIDIHISGSYGKTALEWARYGNHLLSEKYLKDYLDSH